MKPWIKRTLIGFVAAATLFGGLAAWAHKRWQHDWPGHGWQQLSEADAAALKARVVEKIGREMDLDEAQKARLAVLADRLREQRNVIVGTTPDPRAEIRALVAGNAFDRARAQALVTAQTSALSAASPVLIDALADFYDSLRPEQQAQMREFMARQRGHHGRGGRHGEHDRNDPSRG